MEKVGLKAKVSHIFVEIFQHPTESEFAVLKEEDGSFTITTDCGLNLKKVDLKNKRIQKLSFYPFSLSPIIIATKASNLNEISCCKLTGSSSFSDIYISHDLGDIWQLVATGVRYF